MAARPEPNPFRPGFGRMPPIVAGRDMHVGRIRDAMVDGGGEHFLIRGHRGMGKTVLLSLARDAALEQGWLPLSTTASANLVDKLVDSEIPEMLRALEGGKTERAQVTGVQIASVGQISTTRKQIHPSKPTLESRLRELVDTAGAAAGHSGGHSAGRPTGVLLSVDEMHRQALDDLAEVAAVTQALTREDFPIVFVGAGLPPNVHALLEEPRTTFLRRALTVELGPLGEADTRTALLDPFYDAGRRISPDAAELAAQITQSNPHLIQLFGRELWDLISERAGGVTNVEIGADDIASTIPRFREHMRQQLHWTALKGLTERQREYVEAAAAAELPAEARTVREALGWTEQTANNTLTSLVGVGVMYRPQHGRLDFAVPYLQEHVRAEGTSIPDLSPIHKPPRHEEIARMLFPDD
ncbi:ATP-binding protein [Dietzia sp.]|uniref:ATP-binding protein n=1 Tax=Dietzia sp. TaxID=1871616 RepID=UPI002FDA3197